MNVDMKPDTLNSRDNHCKSGNDAVYGNIHDQNGNDAVYGNIHDQNDGNTYSNFGAPGFQDQSQSRASMSDMKCDVPICKKCVKPITDGDFLKAENSVWHRSCFRCKSCEAWLGDIVFPVDDDIFCKSCFLQNHGVKCDKCEKYIVGRMISAHHQKYHPKCFSCEICLDTMFEGQQYVLHNKRLHCIECNDAVRAARKARKMERKASISKAASQPKLPQKLPQKLPMKLPPKLPSSSTPQNSPKSERRRSRTNINPEALEVLVEAFKVNILPSKEERDAIIEITNLPARVVQVWFQNQRAKLRRTTHSSAQSSDSDTGSDHYKRIRSPRGSPSIPNAPKPRSMSYRNLLDYQNMYPSNNNYVNDVNVNDHNVLEQVNSLLNLPEYPTIDDADLDIFKSAKYSLPRHASMPNIHSSGQLELNSEVSRDVMTKMDEAFQNALLGGSNTSSPPTTPNKIQEALNVLWSNNSPSVTPNKPHAPQYNYNALGTTGILHHNGAPETPPPRYPHEEMAQHQFGFATSGVPPPIPERKPSAVR